MGTGLLYNIGSVSSQNISGGIVTTANLSLAGGASLTYVSSATMSGGTITTQNLYINANMISGLTQPWFNSGASNKLYVDTISSNLNSKIVGGALEGNMAGDISGDETYQIYGLTNIEANTAHISGTLEIINPNATSYNSYFRIAKSGTALEAARLKMTPSSMFMSNHDGSDLGFSILNRVTNTAIFGSNTASSVLAVWPDTIDSYPELIMTGGGSITLFTNHANDFNFNEGGNRILELDSVAATSDLEGYTRLKGMDNAGSGMRIYANANMASPFIHLSGGTDRGEIFLSSNSVRVAGDVYIGDDDTLSVSGAVNISGLTTFKRFSFPVLDIIRNTTYTGTLIDGARLTKNQTTGGDSAGGGIGFVFQVENSDGSAKRVGMFGGTLATTTAGSEQGEIVFNVMSGGADVQARHFTIRAEEVGTGDNEKIKAYVGVPYRLQVGKDLNTGYPSNSLDVSGNIMVYSGSIYTLKGSISSQNISGAHYTPIVRGGGKPVAGATYEGQIWRTSGGTSDKTYVWICLKNSSDSYEWIQLGLSS